MRVERGRLWESRAAAYLERHGLAVLAHGYRCRVGELDLVGPDEEVAAVPLQERPAAIGPDRVADE